VRPVLLLPPVLTLGTYKKKKKKLYRHLLRSPTPFHSRPLSLVPDIVIMTRDIPDSVRCPEDIRSGGTVLWTSGEDTPVWTTCPDPFPRHTPHSPGRDTLRVGEGDETPLRVSHTPTPHTDHNHDTITTTECDRERDGVSTPSRVRVEGDECPRHNVHRVGECPLS